MTYPYSNSSSADQVQSTNQTLTNMPGSDWEMLGELRLAVNDSGELIDAWVAETLESCSVSSECLANIGKSAGEALSQVLDGDSLPDSGQIHLRVFAAGQVRPDVDVEQTWGFFRIKRRTPEAPGEGGLSHFIDFYLYVEP
jgi:hypothetical protein